MQETLVSASVYEWRGLHRPGGVSVSCGPPGPSVRGQDYSTSYLKFLHSSPFQVGICSAPCLNRGKCIQKDSCQCRPGFYGATCEFSKARMRHEPQLWSWKCEIETWIDKSECVDVRFTLPPPPVRGTLSQWRRMSGSEQVPVCPRILGWPLSDVSPSWGASWHRGQGRWWPGAHCVQ